VVESRRHFLSSFFVDLGFEEIINVGSVDVAHVVNSELFNEGVALFSEFEDDTNYSEGLLVGVRERILHNEGMDKVELEFMLDAVDLVFGRTMEVDVIGLVEVGALTIDIGDFNSTYLIGRNLQTVDEFFKLTVSDGVVVELDVHLRGVLGLFSFSLDVDGGLVSSNLHNIVPVKPMSGVVVHASHS